MCQYSAVDINNVNGSAGHEVFAIQDGTIDYLKRADGVVRIRHQIPLFLRNGYVYNTWYSFYAHMKNIPSGFMVGTKVVKGDVIGITSNVLAGASIWPHLHFSLYSKYSHTDQSVAISPYWLSGDYFDEPLYADNINGDRWPPDLYDKMIFLDMPGESSTPVKANWYSHEVLFAPLSDTSSPRYDSTISNINPQINGYVQYDRSRKLVEAGCFLSQVKSDVDAATRENRGKAWLTYDAVASGIASKDNGIGKYTIMYYNATGNNATGIGFGRTLTAGQTYYYRFFSVLDNNEVEYGTTQNFKMPSPPAITAITAMPTTLDFGTATTSYAQPAAQTVTITNTGNQSVTLNQPGATNYTIGALNTTTLGAGGTATFSVRPNANLAAGTYNIPISITGSNGVSASVTAQFQVNSYSIGLSPTTLDFGTLNAGYGTQTGKPVTITNTGNQSVTLDTVGRPANYSYSWGSKTTLAAGESTTLTITPATGLTVGNYDVQVFISSTNTAVIAALNLKLTVDRVPVPPTITTDSLPNGTVNTSYSTQQFVATGDTPFTWSHIAGNLPTGMSLSGGGLLGGTPTQTGTFTFMVSVSNGVTPNATKQYTITILAAPTSTMSFTLPSINFGSAMTEYNYLTYGQFATIQNTCSQAIAIDESPQWQNFQLDNIQANPLPSGSSTLCVIQPKEGLTAGT
ncbi:MAG: peptidoglycan DD-metalloendopeptidase family protein, partial [Acinetobacter sp.]